MKEESKLTLFLFAVPFFFFISIMAMTSSAASYSKNDYLTYVGQSVGLTEAYAEYEICNPTNIDFTTSARSKPNFDWYFVEESGKVKDSWFEIRLNESYEQEVFETKEICNPYFNKKNSSIVQNCTQSSIAKSITSWRWVWRTYDPTHYIYQTKACYNIRAYITYELAYGDNAIKIDNVLEFADHTYDEYVWFNVAWERRRPITITPVDDFADHINLPINISFDILSEVNSGQMNPDYSDLRLAFLNGTEIDRIVIQPKDGSNGFIWFNYTNESAIGSAGDTIYMYYENPLASLPTLLNFTDYGGGDHFDNDPLNGLPDSWDAARVNGKGTVVTGNFSTSGTAAANHSFNTIAQTSDAKTFGTITQGEIQFALNLTSVAGSTEFFVVSNAPFGSDGIPLTIDNNLVLNSEVLGNIDTLVADIKYTFTIEFDTDTDKWNYTIYNSTTVLVGNNNNFKVGLTGAGNIRKFGATGVQHWDDLIIRDTKGIYDDPTVLVGAEETLTPPPPPVIVDLDYCQLLWAETNAEKLSNDNWCLDNITLARNITMRLTVDGNVSHITTLKTEECMYSCDNVTKQCAPNPFKLNMWIAAGILGTLLLLALLGRFF